jgi:hypothetical protein
VGRPVPQFRTELGEAPDHAGLQGGIHQSCGW